MVRACLPKDINRINELGLLVNPNFIKLFKMENILEEDYSKVYVYEEKNEILGFLHITELYETVDIVNIVVDKLERKKGIATSLIDYMLTDISSGVKLLTLEVSVSNEAAINLYTKFGFEKINIRKNYYDNGDAYLMGRRLDR